MHGRLFSVRRMMCVNAVLAQANASMSRAPPSWVGVGTWRLSGAFCGPSGYDWTKEGPERHGPHQEGLERTGLRGRVDIRIVPLKCG